MFGFLEDGNKMVLEIKEDELGGHVSGMGEMMNACKLKT
jgi:hypothetical protein